MRRLLTMATKIPKIIVQCSSIFNSIASKHYVFDQIIHRPRYGRRVYCLRISRTIVTRLVILRHRHDNHNFIPILHNSFQSLHGSPTSHYKFEQLVASMESQNSVFNSYTCQRFGISSSSGSSQSNENGTSQNGGEITELGSDSDHVDNLSKKYGNDKEGFLTAMNKIIEHLEYRAAQIFADVENLLEKIKGEAENSKNFEMQNFEERLLYVEDNLGRVSLAFKKNLPCIHTYQDDADVLAHIRIIDKIEKQIAEARFKLHDVTKIVDDKYTNTKIQSITPERRTTLVDDVADAFIFSSLDRFNTVQHQESHEGAHDELKQELPNVEPSSTVQSHVGEEINNLDSDHLHTFNDVDNTSNTCEFFNEVDDTSNTGELFSEVDNTSNTGEMFSRADELFSDFFDDFFGDD